MSAHEFKAMFLLIISKHVYSPIPKSFFRFFWEIDTFKLILPQHVEQFKVWST